MTSCSFYLRHHWPLDIPMMGPHLHTQQHALLLSGSFSGLRPLHGLGSSYLEPSNSTKQPLCGNDEGWGPLSPYRYDFTPCFIDVWVASVSLYGIFFGFIALWLLLRNKRLPESQSSTPKNFHFWLKQACSPFPLPPTTKCLHFLRRHWASRLTIEILFQTLLVVLFFDFVAQLVIQIINFPKAWLGDFRVWTTALTILSLLVIFSLQWVEHSRLRHANGVVLFYWLLLIISLLVKLRSLISQQVYHKNLPYFVVYSSGVALAIVEFLVEWLWPRATAPGNYEAIAEDDECPLEYATVFSKLFFSWMTPLMKRGYKVYLTENDLWALAKPDQTKVTGEEFDEAWHHELTMRPKAPSLWLAMFRAYGGPYMIAALFKIGNDISQYLQPQLLRLLIAFVGSYEKGNAPQPVIQGASIAMGMFACAAFQTLMVVSNLLCRVVLYFFFFFG